MDPRHDGNLSLIKFEDGVNSLYLIAKFMFEFYMIFSVPCFYLLCNYNMYYVKTN